MHQKIQMICQTQFPKYDVVFQNSKPYCDLFISGLSVENSYQGGDYGEWLLEESFSKPGGQTKL